MTWVGTWRNQYDSLVEITGETDGRIEGWFRSALDTSPFFGTDATITGVHTGRAISFVCAAAHADLVVSYTGTLRDGRLETLWLLADGDADEWRSSLTNHDTFIKLL